MSTTTPEPSLDYLLFEESEDTDGVHTFDAMASVQIAQRGAVEAEVARVRAWCRERFPQGPGPLEHGLDWDEDHHWQVESATGGENAWHTVTLTLTGTPAFAQAFRDAFGDAPQ